MKKLNIFSAFDGGSMGQQSLQKYLNPSQYNYFASEIEYGPMNVANHNFPNTVQLGDITKITRTTLPKDIFLMMGGSPCQGFSIAGRKKGMVGNGRVEITSLEQYMNMVSDGFIFDKKEQSQYFWDYVRIMREVNPHYTFLENVVMKGMNKKWEYLISKELGLEPIRINSSLVTAQNRERLYWTNISGVTVPNDLNIMLSDVVQGAVNGYGKSGVAVKGEIKSGDKKYYYPGSVRKDFKANCLTKGGNRRKYVDTAGVVRELTVEHCEVLQGLPIGYTDVIGVTKTDRMDMLGNGWTVPVIEHIFSFIPEFHLEYNEKGVILAETI
jgi:DNA (cytosine-5)-methyltransferase 3A